MPTTKTKKFKVFSRTTIKNHRRTVAAEARDHHRASDDGMREVAEPVVGIIETLDLLRDFKAQIDALPSPRAMGLAKSFVERAFNIKVVGKDETIKQIAEMIDAALRVENARGIADGETAGRRAADRVTARAFVDYVDYVTGIDPDQKIVGLMRSTALVVARYVAEKLLADSADARKAA